MNNQTCGLCGKKIWFFQRINRLFISGLVHRYCFIKFNNRSVLKQIKWESHKKDSEIKSCLQKE